MESKSIQFYFVVLTVLVLVHNTNGNGYYRPLPLFTGSVNELNSRAVWTRTYHFGDILTTTPPPKPENLLKNEARFDIDQIMNDMAVLSSSSTPKDEDKLFRAQQKDSWFSTVKIIPDEHHVSAYMNKGMLKRYSYVSALKLSKFRYNT